MATAYDEKMENHDKSPSNVEIQPPKQTKPTCIIVLGMAGSGKTTFVQVTLFCQIERSNIDLLLKQCVVDNRESAAYAIDGP